MRPSEALIEVDVRHRFSVLGLDGVLELRFQIGNRQFTEKREGIMSLPPGWTANFPEIKSNTVAASKKPLPIFPSELQKASIGHTMLLFTFWLFTSV